MKDLLGEYLFQSIAFGMIMAIIVFLVGRLFLHSRHADWICSDFFNLHSDVSCCQTVGRLDRWETKEGSKTACRGLYPSIQDGAVLQIKKIGRSAARWGWENVLSHWNTAGGEREWKRSGWEWRLNGNF